jgi:hypothetical protein
LSHQEYADMVAENIGGSSELGGEDEATSPGKAAQIGEEGIIQTKKVS